MMMGFVFLRADAGDVQAIHSTHYKWPTAFKKINNTTRQTTARRNTSIAIGETTEIRMAPKPHHNYPMDLRLDVGIRNLYV